METNSIFVEVVFVPFIDTMLIALIAFLVYFIYIVGIELKMKYNIEQAVTGEKQFSNKQILKMISDIRKHSLGYDVNEYYYRLTKLLELLK